MCYRRLEAELGKTHPSVRRREITALASIPRLSERRLVQRLEALVTPSADPFELAALGPAIPTLAAEWSVLWHKVASTLVDHSDPFVVASAVAGLETLGGDGVAPAQAWSLLERALERAQDPLEVASRGETGAVHTDRFTATAGAQFSTQLRPIGCRDRSRRGRRDCLAGWPGLRASLSERAGVTCGTH